MRIALALPLLLLASACNVATDDANDTATIQYDQNTAENVVGDVASTAQNVGGAIVIDVQATGEKVGEKVGNADIDVDVDTNTQSNTQ